ncbi:MAG TPA: adenine phosphoribosyltransferase [Anaerohalosphaeraceae bacterium]|jgi:adenine phosphoribosyltransferase|nr:adenine phosphoribosyltransferase [Anaerohalosphaeraceae bacterium]HRT49489.1 adenine phosphoribosyltransferase [Anaerohalosphaeraceae bacterium]HRT85349.1 adenine phosphoribosyltransferase [Anaerohalosphaeraceae bacterium]
MSSTTVDLKKYIRDVADFPTPGILFRDITPLLADATALGVAVRSLADPFRNQGITHVAAVEARGFILGSAVARELNAGFIPLRKKGKLPYVTEAITYDLEYGSDTIEVHHDAVKAGEKILMVDDLLATGGTMVAACALIERLGAEIAGLTFLIELTSLSGRARLGNRRIHVLISY